jgi:putative SOS response-associated peptidase YedK
MCNRYVLEEWSDDAAAFFGVQAPHEMPFSNYNVAPSQVMPVVAVIEGKRVSEPMKWGLVPMWSKEPEVKYSTYNARSEDLFEKPTWRGAARHHRCLIPATAFYEWEHRGSEKQPYYIHLKGQKYFAFAGLFDEWKGELLTYSIVTTTPNKEMSELHNRMPVLLHPDDWGTWLEPSLQTRDSLEPLLRPYEDGKLEMFEVSRDVNAVRHNYKSLVEPLSDQ